MLCCYSWIICHLKGIPILQTILAIKMTKLTAMKRERQKRVEMKGATFHIVLTVINVNKRQKTYVISQVFLWLFYINFCSKHIQLSVWSYKKSKSFFKWTFMDKNPWNCIFVALKIYRIESCSSDEYTNIF